MRVEADGATFRLTYGAEGDVAPASAVGFDRERLDDALLDLARAAGVDVRTGVTATGLALDGKRPRLTTRAGGWSEAIEARVVIGADGVRSTIARAAGVVRPARLGPRIGLTFHVVDPRPADGPTDARMVILPDAYCGLAPVPGGRVNVGIVLAGDDWRRRLSAEGAAAVAGAILAAVPVSADDPVVWADAEHTDAIEGAAPLGHRVARRAGHGWLLVGDAAGFLDPLTGEGMHRALVSAALAARAVEAHLDGAPDALDRYERAMTRRFRAKDVVTVLIQSFLARPALFGHAARRLEHRGPVRDTMGLVIGDLVPATRALDRGSSSPSSVRSRFAVRSTTRITVAAPPELVFRLAADPLRWPALLPHYAYARAVARHDGVVVADFVARRPLVPVLGIGLPVTWRSRTWAEPDHLRLRFHHVAGATRGMDVTWRIEGTPDGCAGHHRARLPAADPGLGGDRRPILHPAHRRPDAARVQGHGRSPGPRRMTESRRVWITGLGVVSAVGIGVDPFRAGLRAATSPIRAIDRFDASPFRSRVAAQIEDFDPADHMDARSVRGLDRFSQFAVAAGRMALTDAGLQPGDPRHPDPERVGIFLGSALGGIAFAEEQHERFMDGGIRRVAPTLALAVFGGAAPANLGISLGVRGPILSTANSCASGAVALGEALAAIRHGEVDAAVAGGVDARSRPSRSGPST